MGASTSWSWHTDGSTNTWRGNSAKQMKRAPILPPKTHDELSLSIAANYMARASTTWPLHGMGESLCRMKGIMAAWMLSRTTAACHYLHCAPYFGIMPLCERWGYNINQYHHTLLKQIWQAHKRYTNERAQSMWWCSFIPVRFQKAAEPTVLCTKFNTTKSKVSTLPGKDKGGCIFYN